MTYCYDDFFGVLSYLCCCFEANKKKTYICIQCININFFNFLNFFFTLQFYYFMCLLIQNDYMLITFFLYMQSIWHPVFVYFQRYTWPPYWGWGPYPFYLSSSSSTFSTHQSRNPSRSGPDDLSRFSWKYFAGKVPAAIWNPIKQKPLKRLPSLNSPKRLSWRQ